VGNDNDGMQIFNAFINKLPSLFQLESLKEQNYVSFDFLYVVTLNWFLSKETRESDLEYFKSFLIVENLK